MEALYTMPMSSISLVNGSDAAVRTGTLRWYTAATTPKKRILGGAPIVMFPYLSGALAGTVKKTGLPLDPGNTEASIRNCGLPS